MDHYPYWSLESWGSDYPPENAEEIIEQANRIICETEQKIGMGAAARLSNSLWERYCQSGKLV